MSRCWVSLVLLLYLKSMKYTWYLCWVYVYEPLQLLFRSFKLLSSENWCNMQIPSYLSSRREFSVSPKNGPQKLNSGSKAPEPQGRVPKILVGGLALGSFLVAAYYYGALDEYIGKQQQSIREYTNAGVGDKATEATLEQNDTVISGSSLGQSGESSPLSDHAKQDTEIHPEPRVLNDSISTEEEKSFQEKVSTTEEDKSFQEKVATVETPVNVDHVEWRDIPNVPQSSSSSDDETVKPAEESPDLKGSGMGADEPQHTAIETTTTSTSADNTSSDTEMKSGQMEQTTTDDIQEVKFEFLRQG